jgi:hypothetical protein
MEMGGKFQPNKKSITFRKKRIEHSKYRLVISNEICCKNIFEVNSYIKYY